MDCERDDLDPTLALAKLRAVADLVASARDLALLNTDAFGLLLDGICHELECALNRRKTTPPPARPCPKASRPSP